MVISASEPLTMRRIGVLGGTFDPVHAGHLQLAAGMRVQLELDRVLLVPNHVPPHRAQPLASPEQRCAMLELALRGQRRLVLDRRELERAGPSYAVDTLASLRAAYGPEAGLYFLLGSDAFAGLDRWHEWRRLVELCHFAVALRPGVDRQDLQEQCAPALQELLKGSQSEPVATRAAAGRVYVLAGDWPDISATRVRGRELDTGITAVDTYIEKAGLYGSQKENG